jgi:hypothetical protein
MSWSTNDKEEITFTARKYSLTFDPGRTLPINPSNLETMETLINSLQFNPFKDRAGYCFAFALVRLTGKDHFLAHTLLNSFQLSTLKQHNSPWNVFIMFLLDEPSNLNIFGSPYQLIELIQHLLIWLTVGTTVTCILYTFPLIKSAVTSLFEKAFTNVTQEIFSSNSAISTLLSSFKKHHPTKPKYIKIWHIGSFFSWCYSSSNTKQTVKTSSTDNYFMYLQKRVCDLIAVFTLPRPIEIGLTDFSEQQKTEDGIFFHTLIKTCKCKYTPVLIPKIDNFIISPYNWVYQLLTKNKERSNSTYIFIDPKNPNNPLPSSQICAYLFQIIQEMNLLDGKYTPYSFKYATISYLLKNGYDNDKINKACRYTTCKQKDMLSSHYAVAACYTQLSTLPLKAIPKNLLLGQSSSISSSIDDTTFEIPDSFLNDEQLEE